jgi:ribosomal protein L37AE/L43A
VEREFASHLIKVNTENALYYPLIETDQSYSNHEQSRHTNDPKTLKDDTKWRKSLASRIATRFEQMTLPVWREACRLFHHNENELKAFRILLAKFGDDFSSETIRLTVANLYELGRRLSIYWGGKKRRYKLTKREMATGKLECPRCRNYMQKRVYRHGKKNWQCLGCGFAISPKDITNSKEFEDAEAASAIEGD